ncbi:MAG: hypothetical protein J5I93_01750 [Pirellulaceae bacterium]|nr:hypothetical protein [Pirellulaceae bacterium]
MTDTLANLTLILADSSPAVARLTVSLPRPTASGVWQLAGSLHGPRSAYGETLPATYPLRALEVGESVLAECIVPDPCYWSPEYPMLYKLRVELLESGNVRDRVERIVGLRRLSVRRGVLTLEAQRWVLRAVSRHLAPDCTLDDWHESATSLLVDGLDEGLLQQASERGVLVVTCLDSQPGDLAAHLRTLARWPAAGVAVLPARTRLDWDPSQVAPQVVLAQQCPPGQRPVPESWCRLAWCEVGDPEEFRRRVADLQVPVVAVRRANESGSPDQLRAGCDRLQRDLAPFGQYAGYVVS